MAHYGMIELLDLLLAALLGIGVPALVLWYDVPETEQEYFTRDNQPLE